MLVSGSRNVKGVGANVPNKVGANVSRASELLPLGESMLS